MRSSRMVDGQPSRSGTGGSARAQRLAALTRIAVVGALLFTSAAEKYHTDFSGAEVGKVPADMQAITGGYAVAEIDGNKVLELPGNPLEIYGLLFGPADGAELDVRAKMGSASSGRRFPEFGVGLGDVAGYRLLLLPGQKKLELRRGDEPVASVPTDEPWRSERWTWLRLKVAKRADGKWSVEGKAWPADRLEPEAWQIIHEAAEPPARGRASVWGIPFSGKPIRFDDLSVEPANAAALISP